MAAVVKALDGLIIPENIPGDDVKPDAISAVVDGLSSSAGTLRSGADDVSAGWAGLPAVFVAPGAEVVYGAVAPASASAHVFATKVDVVAAALHEYAHGLGPVKRTLAAIKADAVTFRSKIGADGRVWMSPGQTKKYEWDSQAQGTVTRFSTSGGPQAAVDYLHSRGETARVHNGVVQLRALWTESGDFIDQNNRLLDRVADAYATLNALEADCANKINSQRDDCVADVVAVQGWQLKQTGDQTADLPWGHRVDEDRNCGESFWWGAGNAGLGMVQGLGSLVSYNPTTNGWGDWDNAGKVWVGVGTGLGSLLVSTSPIGVLLAGAGVPLFRDAQNTTSTMVKGLLDWDTWSKNPAEAAGAVLVNVGTFFIPGAGEVGGAIKALTIGTKLEIVASAIIKVETVSSKITAAIPDALGDLLSKLKPEHVDTHVHIDVDIPVNAHVTTHPDINIHNNGTPGAHPDAPVALRDHPGDGSANSPDVPTVEPRSSAPLAGGAHSDSPVSLHDPHTDTTATGGQVADPAGRDFADTGDGATDPVSHTGVASDSYRLDDGTDYRPTTGGHPLGPDSMPMLTEAAARHGLTMADLYHLIHERPVGSLTTGEARILLDIRESVPLPATGELMQKVLSEEAMRKLVYSTDSPDTLSGFIGRAADGQKLETPSDYVSGYGLNYIPENGASHPFLDAEGSVKEIYAVRFRLPDGADLNIPNSDLAAMAGNNFPTHQPSYYHPDRMGTPGVDGNPYLGNGFVGTGAKEIIPEYHVPYESRFEVGNGAEVWRITPGGDEVLVAVRRNDTWETVL